MARKNTKKKETIRFISKPKNGLSKDLSVFAHHLSSRELDVLILIKDGLKNPEIAEQIGLSTKTVENHVRSILIKLGAKNRTDAVIIAVKNELIEI